MNNQQRTNHPSVPGKGNFTKTVAARQARIVVNGVPDRAYISHMQRKANNVNPNAAQDRLYPLAPVDDVHFKVELGDILLTKVNQSNLKITDYQRNGRKRRKKRPRNKDPDPPVIASANGIFLNNSKIPVGLSDAEKEAFMRNEIEKQFKFVGFSDTIYDYDSNFKELQKTGIVCHIGGTRSIRNTGMKTIKAWQNVIWKLPDWNNRPIEDGVNKNTLKFETAPFDPKNALAWENLIVRVNNLTELPAGKMVELGDTLDDMVKAFANLTVDENGVQGATLEQFKQGFQGSDGQKFRYLFETFGLIHNAQREKIIGRMTSTTAPSCEGDIITGSHF